MKGKPRSKGKQQQSGSQTQTSYNGDWDSKRDKEERGKQDRSSARNNDPKWYTPDPQILRDAASIPFSWAVGTPIDFNNVLLNSLSNRGMYAVPGIQVIELVPTVGYSVDSSSPLNVAAASFYTWVRHMNSGHANYDAPDLMIYALAMSSVYSYIVWLQRLYAFAMFYAQMNKYIPDALISANGVDAQDVRQHLADFRYGINVLITKASAMAVPGDIPIFNRHAFLYKNIYTEGTSIKDQLYMYVPSLFWKFTYAADGSGELAYQNLPVNATVEQLLAIGNEMISTIFDNEDMNIMSGDIKKAYGDNIIKMVLLDTYYPIVPIFDIGVLEQMKNANVVEHFGNGNTSSAAVVQEGNHGYLSSIPISTSAAPATDWQTAFDSGNLNTLAENKILSTTTFDVTPELVIESTRLMVGAFGYVKATDTTPGVIRLYCGSEVAVNARFITFAYPQSGQSTEIFTIHYNDILDTAQSETDWVALMRKISVMASFKFHPAWHIIAGKAGSTGNTYSVSNGYVMWDVDNYAILTTQDIQRMHEAALLGLLHVPSVGRLR